MRAHYLCQGCEARFEIGPDIMLCPYCSASWASGQPLLGVLRVVMDGDVPKRWKPLDLLPVEPEHFPAITVGETPLFRPEIGQRFGVPHLYFKDDTRNPTGSLKDRASFLVSAFARKYAISTISLASTGNAGSSMAGIAAAAGQRTILFLPETVSRGKLAQALYYGARVVLVRGNYDRAYEISMQFSRERGTLNRNTGFNPLTIEGKKTVSLEIVCQLGRSPDIVFVPTGDGVILAGVYKGFEDLIDIGVINQVPMIYAVQAVGSNAIVRGLNGENFTGAPASTCASSIAVDMPCNGHQALSLLRKYGGRALAVTDEEILAARFQLSSQVGLFVEPSSAAAFAAFKSERHQFDRRATVVVLATGHGLKEVDVTTAQGEALIIISSLEDLAI